MSLKIEEKNTIAETLRQEIIARVPQVRETDRAALSLCTLSFQSGIYLERHVWIDTDEGEIKIDLEDWRDENEWDNAVARVAVESAKDAVDLIRAWLSGNDLKQYSNLNKEYEIVKPVAR